MSKHQINNFDCGKKIADGLMQLDNKFLLENEICLLMSEVAFSELHTHDFIEFVYMLSGESLHYVDGDEYLLKYGDLLIINYNQSHTFNGDSNAKYCNILIKPSIIDKALDGCDDLFLLFETTPYKEFQKSINNKCHKISFCTDECKCFENILFSINRELKQKRTGYELIVKSGINFLLTMIFREMCSSVFKEKQGFELALEYINKHFEQNLTLSYIAKICHYNPSYFSRVFKKYTGVTFTEHLKKLRINRACDLLIEKNIRVNDVFSQVGYTNKTIFYKHFYQITGKKPSDYKVKK